MSGNTAFVLLLVAGILGGQALAWVLVLRWFRRRVRALAAQVAESCSSSGQPIVLGPAAANYSGADFQYGRVRGSGVLCVTRDAIVFAKVVGKWIEIPRAEVHEITEERRFNGKVAFGSRMTHLVFHTRDGNRIGFLLREAAAWKERLVTDRRARSNSRVK